jgi:hypothetical protein
VAIEANAAKGANKAGKLDKHDEADDADNKTEVAIEAKADKANDAAKAVEVVEAKADKRNDAITAVDKTIEANDANEFVVVDDANEADWIDDIVVADDSIVIYEVVLGLLTWFVPFSLTKHSAIFVEVKGCFEFLDMNKNQLGTFCIECDWGSTCSLRN